MLYLIVPDSTPKLVLVEVGSLKYTYQTSLIGMWLCRSRPRLLNIIAASASHQGLCFPTRLDLYPSNNTLYIEQHPILLMSSETKIINLVLLEGK